MPMQALPPKKDWFLYLMMDDRICRLNIDEFCKRNSPKPQFEIVHDYYPNGDYRLDTTIPQRMQPIVVGSKVYMFGGESTRTCNPEMKDSDSDVDSGGSGRYNSENDYRDDRERVRRHVDSRVPNLDVFAFDPNASEGPTISLCIDRTIPRRLIDPRLIDPKTLSGPKVFTLEDKIYVMARTSYLGDEEDMDHHPPLFKVFDPLHQIWKELPRPPYCDDNSLSLYRHSAWGHKLVTCNTQSGLNLFDIHQEKWEQWPEKKEEKEDEGNNQSVFMAVVEFEGFLIGVEYHELTAYQLDPNGIPKLFRDLHELQGIFCPFLLVSNCVMGKCDGGRMWLVYTGKDLMDFYHTRVAVFQVYISDDLDGNPVLSTELEAAEFYFFQNSYATRSSCAAFSMCHHSNNRDIEEKNLCGTILAHDHPRG